MRWGEERTSVFILSFSFILQERRENICLSLASPFSVAAVCGTHTPFLFKKRKEKEGFCCVPSLYSLLVGKFLMKDVFLCFSSIEKKRKKEKCLRRRVLETMLANTMSYEKREKERKIRYAWSVSLATPRMRTASLKILANAFLSKRLSFCVAIMYSSCSFPPL